MDERPFDHQNAGYVQAIDAAARHDVTLPSLAGPTAADERAAAHGATERG